MGLNVNDVIAGLDPARRRKIEDRAAELIAEEMTLRDLRKARQLTQVSVARELGISQDGVARLVERADLLLSTLRRTVEAWVAVSRSSRPSPAGRRSSCLASPSASPATEALDTSHNFDFQPPLPVRNRRRRRLSWRDSDLGRGL